MTDKEESGLEKDGVAEGADVVVDGRVVGKAVVVDDPDDLWYDKEREVDGEGLGPAHGGGNLRAETLASNARRQAAAEEVADQEEKDQRAARALVPADKSSNTRWAQPSRRQGPETLWHGYSYVGAYQTVSYCGVEHRGSFRRSPPPRDNAVCEKCARACGFARRSRRVRGERQRGSRRLGNIVDRMEVAVDGMEVAVDGMERVLEGLGRALATKDKDDR